MQQAIIRTNGGQITDAYIYICVYIYIYMYIYIYVRYSASMT